MFRFKLQREKPIIISVVTGNFFTDVYMAPKGFRSILFSNNPELRNKAVKKKWEFFLLQSDRMKLSDSFIECSIQSKYVKFLGFIKDYQEFNECESFLYIDHKIELTPKKIRFLLGIKDKNKSILIRNGKIFKNSIWDEVNAALPYPRYSTSMPATLEYISEVMMTQNLQEKVRIMNTGLIYYTNINTIIPLLEEVLDAIYKLTQPSLGKMYLYGRKRTNMYVYDCKK